MSNEIEMIPVTSSNVDAVGYDGITNELRVRFKSGLVYAYSNVPLHVFVDLLNAESHGKYLAAEVKGKYPYKLMGKIE